ncbi:hypothetical protein KDI_38160 [Dictyobacter arantiisoli]|uniref:Peptidase C51 domain-containing protein n=1 Tax=Dictyobacter arantiisoli TaxID=2014874 RepID=A0A5A5TFQ9_9CHLR|nr:hypothetical protein KDI_38160 [Dictyobacter arantiisoli]
MESIAAAYGVSTSQMATYNHLSPSSLTYINQRICIPSAPFIEMSSTLYGVRVPPQLAAPLAMLKHATYIKEEQRDQPAAPTFQAVPDPEMSLSISAALKRVPRGFGPLAIATAYRNAYPFGQCTWWASQRYYQLHNVLVPWTFNANAGEWVDRALNFGWHVSSIPTVGSILVLSGGVQGADPVGHVAIVEQVKDDGMVIASSMNWGKHPGSITNSLFHEGPGVAFISQ